jgi:hypothetical protein
MNKFYDIPKTYEEHAALEQHLAEHEARHLQDDIDEIDRALFILDGNFGELMSIINRFGSRETWVYFDVRNRNQLERYLLEIARQIHNFVAASKTVVDQSRRVIEKRYIGTDFQSEYEARITQELLESGPIQFVHDLRNFILHRSIPPVAAVLDLNKISHRLILDVPQLQKWKGWCNVSKDYLANTNEGVDLADTVNAYMEVVRHFHDWRFARQSEIHKAQFEDYNRLDSLRKGSRWAISL